ncbi:hypothetical protein SmJEL517_g01775 [Synchytrium microbalum]|uniref:Casein kinase substrate phosphoprotein PP28 domain-containing protein n=1 Tax=Synchytrium microbalum TaxID=1806994 RepID=A0A507CDA2_9FUNG|nr:uncharacterized protein SmJEL517_g01775 [Synchytrium microbalum]TPX36026.1 hypothetical protein SmJEL517_g01775 [Synchytrium microbalum]
MSSAGAQAAARKGKYNKTKRGGSKRFTQNLRDQDAEAEGIERPEGENTDDSDDDDDEEPTPRSKPTKTSKTTDDEDDGDEEVDTSEIKGRPQQRSGGGGDADEDDDDAEEGNKKKGPASVIDISNPNAPKRQNVKVSELGKSGAPRELSRREREQMEKERAQAAFWKAQNEGRTEQARSDLARLAIIKKERAEAAAKKAAAAAAPQASASKQSSLQAGKAVISKSLSGTSMK